jgi:triosephosphate isomerase
MTKAGRKPLIAGNWKMNLDHREAIALVQKLAFTFTEEDFERTEIVVIPPFTDLRSVQTLVDGDHYDIAYGAQDLSPHPDGAHTGDISGTMLARLGCRYVIVGHSERRTDHHESDDVVNAKVRAAFTAGLTPILCVGESLEIRQAGGHVTHCVGSLTASLAGVSRKDAETVVVAYEPVWAIGTGEVALPEHAQEVCAALRGELASLYDKKLADGVRILYGGSVKADNARGIMAEADVDGALVGGASLVADEFVGIVRWTS